MRYLDRGGGWRSSRLLDKGAGGGGRGLVFKKTFLALQTSVWSLEGPGSSPGSDPANAGFRLMSRRLYICWLIRTIKKNSVSLRWKSASFFLQVLTESVRNISLPEHGLFWQCLDCCILLLVQFCHSFSDSVHFRNRLCNPPLQGLEQGPHSDQEPFCAGEIIGKSIYYK